jgi:hypothetical protein
LSGWNRKKIVDILLVWVVRTGSEKNWEGVGTLAGSSGVEEGKDMVVVGNKKRRRDGDRIGKKHGRRGVTRSETAVAKFVL